MLRLLLGPPGRMFAAVSLCLAPLTACSFLEDLEELRSGRGGGGAGDGAGGAGDGAGGAGDGGGGASGGAGGQGEGGLGGAGGSGGSDPCGDVQPGSLYGCELIVRYFIDEAASGTTPAALLDAAPEPFDLPLTYGGVMQYSEQVGHRGLRWTAAGEDDGAFAAVAGTKVFDLDGSTVGSIEVVADIDRVTHLGTRLAHIGGGIQSGLTMAASFPWLMGEPEVDDATWVEIRTGYPDRFVTARYQVNLFRLGRVVLHAVVDTSAEAEDDRARLYLNGVRIPLDSYYDANRPEQGAPLTLEPQSSLGVGNRAIGERSPEGAIFYVAYYGHALSEAQLQHNVGLLQVEDDATP